MTIIDWKTIRQPLNTAIAGAGVLADLGRELLAELDTAGAAYDRAGNFKTSIQTSRLELPIPPANLAAVDKITREGLAFFGINLAALNLGPWLPGETDAPTLGGRLSVLRTYDTDADPFWKQAMVTAQKLLIPPVTFTETPVVTGDSSPAATDALNATLTKVSQFLAVLAS